MSRALGFGADVWAVAAARCVVECHLSPPPPSIFSCLACCHRIVPVLSSLDRYFMLCVSATQAPEAVDNPVLLRVVQFSAKALLDLLNPDKNPAGYEAVQRQIFRSGRYDHIWTAGRACARCAQCAPLYGPQHARRTSP
jgi:hypothetical protein